MATMTMDMVTTMMAMMRMTISSSMWSPSSPGAATDIGRVENSDVALLNIKQHLFSNLSNIPGRGNVGRPVGESHPKETLLKGLEVTLSAYMGQIPQDRNFGQIVELFWKK